MYILVCNYDRELWIDYFNSETEARNVMMEELAHTLDGSYYGSLQEAADEGELWYDETEAWSNVRDCRYDWKIEKVPSKPRSL